MYIAFKWLVGLAVTMWLAMCGVDLYLTNYFRNPGTSNGKGVPHSIFGFLDKNFTEELRLDLPHARYAKEQQDGFAVVHFVIFLSGALVVSLFHRKDEIICYTRRKIPKISLIKTIKTVKKYLNTEYLKRTATRLYVASSKYYKLIWGDTKNIALKSLSLIYDLVKKGKLPNRQRINFILLKKLKEIGEERRNLGQLLIAAIHENKNIRMHYQLESMAKNRLVRHIENTQKEIKENRSRYVSFQQLYLVTHQENIYLKSRIKKLTKDKEEAERNLMELIHEVYKSKNNELKVYCSRFIVRTKEALLNSDVGAEIQKFLQKSRDPLPSTSRYSQYLDIDDDIKGLPKYSAVTDLLTEYDSLVPLVSDAPKLKGLPGEYVWTVKDKHGLIEKLYEYDFETNINEGDTIKRIRQYSVYYDKDCLLDFSRSKSVINQTITDGPNICTPIISLDYPVATQRFLTGSEAFQKFLQSNHNVVSSSKSPPPPLLFG